MKLGDGIGGSKDHSFSCEGTGGDSVHAVSSEYLVDEIAAGKCMCQESWGEDTSQRVSYSYKIVLWA